jgi:L-asparaginase / beta-aspartyl-peptidase
MSKFTIVIHGGAGTIRRDRMTEELEREHKSGLESALKAGYGILEKGGTAVDAVLASVRSLEDNLLFNAGRGAVFAKDGSQEMDAAIMDGKTKMAGAVAAIKNVRNPVDLAQMVMLNSQHVLLIGKSAVEFGKNYGIRLEPDEYFFSQRRYEQWMKLQDSGGTALDHDVQLSGRKMGTVGAVACDVNGDIAAATSTGGMTNKDFGRVGDSPIIGAGTYANNDTCAISCTGHGEPFMIAVAAYDVSCLMEYRGMILREAMHFVVHDKLLKFGGDGGMIGVDKEGNGEMIFNSEGMYRAKMSSSGESEISIYK